MLPCELVNTGNAYNRGGVPLLEALPLLEPTPCLPFGEAAGARRGGGSAPAPGAGFTLCVRPGSHGRILLSFARNMSHCPRTEKIPVRTRPRTTAAPTTNSPG